MGIVWRVSPGSWYPDDGFCPIGLDFRRGEAYAYLELSALRGCWTRASFIRYGDGKERPMTFTEWVIFGTPCAILALLGFIEKSREASRRHQEQEELRQHAHAGA